MTIRVCDVETTGDAPPEHAVVELASVDFEEDTRQFLAPRSKLVNPGRSIPPETRAIHHISDQDVVAARCLEEVVPQLLTQYPADNLIAYAAHNAKFEMQWLAPFTGKVPWLCTYKIALRLWSSAPNHKNQTLRYFLKLDIPETLASPVHRALPDAIVTAYILRAALKLATVAQMLEWSKEPALLPRCPIGKEWRGKPWADVEAGFLSWILKQEDMESDLKWNAERELKRRTHSAEKQSSEVPDAAGCDPDVDHVHDPVEARAVYVDMCLRAIKTARSVADLEEWWRSDREKANRALYGIDPQGQAFKELVKACAEQKKTFADVAA
jgi:exodeoxyribonuclease X